MSYFVQTKCKKQKSESKKQQKAEMHFFALFQR